MIRKADINDLHQIVRMAEIMHAESAYKNIEFIPSMTEAFLKIVIEDENYVTVVDDHEGILRGAILGGISPYFFNPALRVCDISFYVRPEHRGSSCAPKMLRFYEEYAKQRGCKESYLGVSTGDETAGAFYMKMGYTHIGTCYKKEL